ncbi:hypothetical protein ABZY16_08740 [Streptomyces sp. NPDC006553]|uniref:hypothetical protein n=1 Tax=unclassified Streptomyces TaxID=2593676 RepID=UPI002257EFFA|nr:hypothetical protein [Streptomyces sp. NBC_00233]MCX5226654.1 hypothetical protein [Streptomyces sp. NBC_00233]
MTRLREYLLTGAALGLLGVGAVGCTGQGAAAPTSAPTSTPPAGGTAAAAAHEKRVKDVLDRVSPDAPEFIESGTERVEDGVHHRSRLTKGSAYQLAVVCAGEGAVVPVVGGEDIPAVPCDGVPVTHRIASAPAELPLAVTGRAGASGTVGWRIVAVTG